MKRREPASIRGLSRRGRDETAQSALAARLRSAILSRVLVPNARLPSARALSAELSLARGTVVAVYAARERGLSLTARRGRHVRLGELASARSAPALNQNTHRQRRVPSSRARAGVAAIPGGRAGGRGVPHSYLGAVTRSPRAASDSTRSGSRRPMRRACAGRGDRRLPGCFARGGRAARAGHRYGRLSGSARSAVRGFFRDRAAVRGSKNRCHVLILRMYAARSIDRHLHHHRRTTVE